MNINVIAAALALFGSVFFASAAEPPHDLALDLGNGISLKLVLIPAGKFLMGSPEDEQSRNVNEGPQHEVTISKSFYMSIYPVTQQQYEAVMGVDPPVNAGTNPSVIKGPNYPVQPMRYEAITAFYQSLSKETGKKVRLNTEAEFEYAYRAGTQTTFFWGDDEKQGNDYGWFQPPESKHPHPVGQKKPNPWGLYDMGGSVSQVCSDWGAHYPKPTESDYTKDPVTDPTGPSTGEQHVARGLQGWVMHSRSAGHRVYYAHPEYGDHLFGFRVVVESTSP